MRPVPAVAPPAGLLEVTLWGREDVPGFAPPLSAA